MNGRKQLRRCPCCSQRKDRQRLLTLLDRVLADKRVQRIKPSAEQAATSRASAACSARCRACRAHLGTVTVREEQQRRQDAPESSSRRTSKVDRQSVENGVATRARPRSFEGLRLALRQACSSACVPARCAKERTALELK